VKCVHNSGKPAKKGYIRAIKLLNVKNTEIAAVGDQIFTDVYGGNRLNMHTILVKPIEIKDIWITKIKRPLENFVLTKYKHYDYQNDSKRLNWKKKSAKNKKIA
jgi:predicted HAD superfamily phosphohydrolase YqeG